MAIFKPGQIFIRLEFMIFDKKSQPISVVEVHTQNKSVFIFDSIKKVKRIFFFVEIPIALRDDAYNDSNFSSIQSEHLIKSINQISHFIKQFDRLQRIKSFIDLFK